MINWSFISQKVSWEAANALVSFKNSYLKRLLLTKQTYFVKKAYSTIFAVGLIGERPVALQVMRKILLARPYNRVDDAGRVVALTAQRHQRLYLAERYNVAQY